MGAASRAQGVVLDIVAYNVVASACARLSMWSRAMEVQQQALLSKLPLSAVSYNSALSACEKSSRWESALHLLSEAMTSGFRDIVGHSSAISACEKAALWPLALSLLWKAPMDVIGFSAAISACEKGLQWELALDALGACQPDAICCSSAIVALGPCCTLDVGYHRSGEPDACTWCPRGAHALSGGSVLARGQLRREFARLWFPCVPWFVRWCQLSCALAKNLVDHCTPHCVVP